MHFNMSSEKWRPFCAGINSLSYQTKFTNPTIHLSHIPQCIIQNRNVHIFVQNGALWDTGQVHCGICEIGPLSASWYNSVKDKGLKAFKPTQAHATYFGIPTLVKT